MKLFNIFNKSEKPVRQKTIEEWFHLEGDRTFRLDYDNLSSDSVVYDLGGYLGDWSSDIFSKYTPHIYIFEPYPIFFDSLCKRFTYNEKIRVFNFGLASTSRLESIFVNGDTTSLFKNGNGIRENIELKGINDFIVKQKTMIIDLIKINIEGGEYELLEFLVASGNVKFFKNIQVQFHDFMPDAESRMRKIQDDLMKTHHLTYSFPFVWENWEINN